jgi:class 3 adenylate cyclase/tetratricopeptide (TPR) repeat protein
MRCPACGHENPEGAKFCNECAAKIELTCPRCNKINLPESKFCNECGHPLSAPVSAPKASPPLDPIAKLKRYLPTGLAEKILAQRDRIEGERRQVTVLFCDLAGYTPLTEKLGPEEAYALMDRVFEILIHKVHDFEGTVNELTGDGIIGLFGAPIALEDAPQRAIRSALAIHWEMARFNEQLQKEGNILPPLRMRVGIHTGPVVVGTLGNDLRVDFKVVGDTVNLASRMEGLAEPGSTYVTEDTFKLTEGLFRFEGLGEKAIKGKEKPIRIYRVIAPSTSRTRFDVSAERGLTPFVGRERERELLLDAFERARQGRGQAVSIVSEAGMGKSRLLYEFRKAVLNEDITFLEGKCLSFSRAVAYQPIADILKSNFDIRDGDPDLTVRNKVKQGLKTIGVEEEPATPYLLELLSVKESGIEQIAISPEGKKDKTIETLKRIVLKGSQKRPLVIAIEDLHWIDKTSEGVLKYLLESIAGARVLLILTYRPEFIPTWGARSYHNQLLLNRLSNRESLFMATHILGTGDLETALEELILEKTEGIPFFVEEFIKSLKDLGLIERKDATYRISKALQTIRIPSTIQDIIMARVDALPEGAKELLQVGSLIEREFGYKLIKAAMHLPEEELLRRLSILKDVELLYERGLFPDSTFVFKHALTREVVYGTLLEKKMKELHLDIGQAIEEVHQDNLEEMYGPLAEHFEVGGDYEKAAHYYRLAARKARSASVYIDAIALSKKGVACLEKLPQTQEIQKLIIDARVNLARLCGFLNYYVEGREALAPIIDLSHQLDYRKRLPAIYAAMACYLNEGREALAPIIDLSHQLDYRKRLPAIYAAMACYLNFVEEKHNEEEARHYLTETIRLAPKENDFWSLWTAYYHEGLRHGWNCEFAEGESCLIRIIEMSQAAGDGIGIVVGKFNISYFIYGPSGRLDEALEFSREALRLATQADDLYLKGGAYSGYGGALFLKGIFPEAEENLMEGLDLNQKADFTGVLMITFWCLGMLRFEMGQYNEARQCFDGLLAVCERVKNLPSFARVAQIWRVSGGVLGHIDPKIDEVLNFNIDEIRLWGWQGMAAHGMGEIFLNIDDAHLNEAEYWIKKAIERDAHFRQPWYLAWDHALYSKFFKKKGDPAQAKESLHKAIELMRGCGADGWVEKYEKELASIA